MSDFPPVYLYKDEGGREYTLEVVRLDAAERSSSNGNGLRKRYIDADDRARLARIKVKVKHLPDLDLTGGAYKADKQSGCFGTYPPTAFTILGTDNNPPVGSIGICKLNIERPANSHTHWIQFIVGSYRVSANQVHVPVIAWFKPVVHGHGMYFGDTSVFPCTNNGQSAAYNSRIEAWSLWSGHEGAGAPYWSTTGPSYTGTCGTAWSDTPVNMGGIVVDTGLRYRVTVHASDTQALAYTVDRRNSGGPWQVHTPTVWQNVTYATNWPGYPAVYGQFDPMANGLALIGVSSPGTAGSWFVTVNSLGTGWF